MSAVKAVRRPRQDTTINVRVSTMVRDLIDNAANVLGKTRTDFIVESARKQAVDVLLDQRFFALEPAQHEEFIRALDAPPLAAEKLRKLMGSRSPWKK